ncbi:hypothetical protein ANCDUO_26769 [Ancylostoma duodenale]|uniref:Uncharacterized protein n=1 Tax=Ancylostoma duodenale TaxID=51022 RepID=A0A0C2F3W5_9BILA|nr:hypothetical protein ANCDUO_26769 [Ancylostoma duodenale]
MGHSSLMLSYLDMTTHLLVLTLKHQSIFR